MPFELLARLPRWAGVAAVAALLLGAAVARGAWVMSQGGAEGGEAGETSWTLHSPADRAARAAAALASLESLRPWGGEIAQAEEETPQRVFRLVGVALRGADHAAVFIDGDGELVRLGVGETLPEVGVLAAIGENDVRIQGGDGEMLYPIYGEVILAEQDEVE